MLGIDAQESPKEFIDSKFESQGRHVFLVLALIAALGLYNAAAPHFTNKDSDLSGASTSEPDARTERREPTP